MSETECDLLCIDFDHAEALRAALPAPRATASTSARIKALADPTRLRIMHALELGAELCVCDLAWVIGSSQALVSHHLRQLRASELVDSRKDGKLVMYQATSTGHEMLQALRALPQDTSTDRSSVTAGERA